jgi:two-component system response regulator DctR
MNSQTTIYLCDDDQDLREGLAFLLRQSEFDVRALGGGQELLEAIRCAPQPLRAVFVLDLDMPAMSGDVVHDQLISLGYTQCNPVIFLSGRGTIARAMQAINKGALDFVEKPYTSDALLPLLRKAVALEAQWHSNKQRREFLRLLWASLSPQQRKVAMLVAQGDLNKVIAGKLDIGDRMVEVHRAKAFEKLGVDSSAELATTIASMKSFGLDLCVEVPA